MSHGFMGVGPIGWLYTAGSVVFFAYLSQSFKGPERPKFQVDPIIADLAKETQPALNAEYYYNKK